MTERPYRALRAAVGTIILLGITGLWAASKLEIVPPLGAMWDVVVLGIVIAGGYAVYGEATMTAAMDDAQEFTGADSDTGPVGESAAEGATVADTPDIDPRDGVEEHLEAGE